MKVTFAIQDDNDVTVTSVQDNYAETIDDVLLTVVRGLLGHSFSKGLIQQYINYDPENFEVNKFVEDEYDKI